MQIRRSSKYKTKLLQILYYIAQDKLSASIKFYTALDQSINHLSNFPYKFQQSEYQDKYGKTSY